MWISSNLNDFCWGEKNGKIVRTYTEFWFVTECLCFCHHPLGQDEEIRKIQAVVTAGMSAIVDQIYIYRKSWDKYKGIWETNKDSFVERYGRLNTPVSSFDADLNRYDHSSLWDTVDSYIWCLLAEMAAV